VDAWRSRACECAYMPSYCRPWLRCSSPLRVSVRVRVRVCGARERANARARSCASRERARKGKARLHPTRRTIPVMIFNRQAVRARARARLRHIRNILASGSDSESLAEGLRGLGAEVTTRTNLNLKRAARKRAALTLSQVCRTSPSPWHGSSGSTRAPVPGLPALPFGAA
jgi:hypothetical protein